MLTVLGARQRFCDGLTRRNFLRIGGLAVGGLTLPDLLRHEAKADTRSSHKSVIMVFLPGGPPHQDLVDLKPDAPAEVRGEFKPIATRVPGIQICEHLPQLAERMDRFAVIRSVVGCAGEHASYQCMTGYDSGEVHRGNRPAFGAYISRLQGPAVASVPPFVCLSPRMTTSTWAYCGDGGFLGRTHAPFVPNQGSAELTLNVPPDRLAERRVLQGQLDTLRRQLDGNGNFEGLDQVTRRAYELLTSSKVAEALDLEREDVRLRDRYGRGSPKPAGYGDAAPLLNDYFLAARRLVEAGVRVVTLSYGRWDWHGKPHGTTFENAREHFPMLDKALTALIDDLEQRGMLQDVTVAVWGEFGRTPKLNPNAGRDHWPSVSCALLAGGGLRTGQVIGATDAWAAYAKDRPVHVRDILATLYQSLGIDVNTRTVDDPFGRPMGLLDGKHQALPELVTSRTGT
jgi:hypothetical protein